MLMRSGRFGAVLISACAVLATVSGCATGGQKGTAREDVVCTREAPVGSHIVQPSCESREEIEARRRADRAAMDKLQTRANRPAMDAAGRSGAGH